MTRIHFIDTETTGLVPGRHVPWEVARIIYDTEQALIVDVDTWQLPVSAEELGRAEEIALEVSRWSERRYANLDQISPPYEFLQEFHGGFGDGDHWAGAMPWFDEAMLMARMDTWVDHIDQWPTISKVWHYHLIDVENQALGFAKGQDSVASLITTTHDVTVPWKHVEIMEALGIPTIGDDLKHTALGDATSALTAYVWMHEGAGEARKILEALT